MEAQQTYSDASLVPDAANDAHAQGPRAVTMTPTATRYIQERLGRAIRHRRRMMELTLQDLAGACGVTFQQVHKYEAGLCSISAAQLWGLSLALKVPVSYFYDSVAVAEIWRTGEPAQIR